MEEANAKLAKSKRTTWGSWVEHNLGIKRPTADVYIRLWENKDALKAGGAKSISQARAMLPPERVKPPKPEDDEEPDDDDNSAELSEEAKLRLSSQRTRTLIELLKITEPKRKAVDHKNKDDLARELDRLDQAKARSEKVRIRQIEDLRFRRDRE